MVSPVAEMAGGEDTGYDNDDRDETGGGGQGSDEASGGNPSHGQGGQRGHGNMDDEVQGELGGVKSDEQQSCDPGMSGTESKMENAAYRAHIDINIPETQELRDDEADHDLLHNASALRVNVDPPSRQNWFKPHTAEHDMAPHTNVMVHNETSDTGSDMDSIAAWTEWRDMAVHANISLLRISVPDMDRLVTYQSAPGTKLPLYLREPSRITSASIRSFPSLLPQKHLPRISSIRGQNVALRMLVLCRIQLSRTTRQVDSSCG